MSLSQVARREKQVATSSNSDKTLPAWGSATALIYVSRIFFYLFINIFQPFPIFLQSLGNGEFNVDGGYKHVMDVAVEQ
jgi:hypothetical protein